jgi:hypothetical protein
MFRDSIASLIAKFRGFGSIAALTGGRRTAKTGGVCRQTLNIMFFTLSKIALMEPHFIAQPPFLVRSFIDDH